MDFVPVAIAALRVAPTDPDVRLLLARAYAALGLKTAAHEQILALPEQVIEHPSVIDVSRAIDQLPDDRVPIQTLERTLLGNLDALALRPASPIDLREHVGDWRERARAREHFRGWNMFLAWRPSPEPGRQPPAWSRFLDVPARLASASLPFDASPGAAGGVDPPAPILIEGADPPELLARVLRATAPRGDGYRSLVTLMQSDPLQLMDGLMQIDLASELRDDRVSVLVGPSATSTVLAELEPAVLAGHRPIGLSIAIPTSQPRLSPSPSEIIARVERARASALDALALDVSGVYAGRDRAFWAARFAARRTQPLRVLMVTSRYTTYVRHAIEDLGEALAAQGCSVRTVFEPTEHATFDPLGCLRQVREHEPDLVIVANFPRSTLGAALPGSVPFVLWLQDLMPHQQSKEVGRAMGPLDFVVGNLREEMFQHWLYPRSRSLPTPMCVSGRKFHDGPVSADLARRLECEVAYVSHHAEPPESLHARKVREAGGSPGLPRALEAMFPRVMELIERPVDAGPIGPELRSIVRVALSSAGLVSDDRAVALVTGAYAYPIADRALRHQTLSWAADICQKHGWRMRVYGRGWESHQRFAALAGGELPHDEALRVAYRSARAHLHMSAHTAIHQRVFECALSGGLALCRLIADDLSLLEYLAGAAACRAGAESEIDPAVELPGGYRMHLYPADHPLVRPFADLRARLGLGGISHVRLGGIHIERLRSDPGEPIDGVGLSITDMFQDPAEVMFHDRERLEHLLVRAVEDDAWREAARAGIASRAATSATTEALASRMLEFIGERLGQSDPGDGRRWYDGHMEGNRLLASFRPSNQRSP